MAISKNIVQLPRVETIKTHQPDFVSEPSKHLDQITLDGDIYTSSLVTLEENEPWKFRRDLVDAWERRQWLLCNALDKGPQDAMLYLTLEQQGL